MLSWNRLLKRLESPKPATRAAAIRAACDRCDTDRTAPAWLAPLIGDALADPDPGVREAALTALTHLGEASRPFTPLFRRLAAGAPLPSTAAGGPLTRDAAGAALLADAAGGSLTRDGVGSALFTNAGGPQVREAAGAALLADAADAPPFTNAAGRALSKGAAGESPAGGVVGNALVGDVAGAGSGEFEPEGWGGPSVADRAIGALQHLGDPAWVDVLCDARAAGRTLPGIGAEARLTPEVFAAVRRRLGAEPGTVGLLAGWLERWAGPEWALERRWGADLTSAVPELIAARRHDPEAVAGALLAIGHDDPAGLPYLIERVERLYDLPAAVAIWRMTGDAHPTHELLRAFLRRAREFPRTGARVIDQLGPALAPLEETARALIGRSAPAGSAPAGSGPVGSGLVGGGLVGSGLVGGGLVGGGLVGSGQVGSGLVGSGPVGSSPAGSGPVGSAPAGNAPPESAPARNAQVLAARILAVLGDRASAAAALRVVLQAGGAPAGHAAQVAGDFRLELKPELRALLADFLNEDAAAEALARLGEPAGETPGGPLDEALDLAVIVELRRAGAVPLLERLAGQDERLPVFGRTVAGTIWSDELQRDRIRAVVRELRSYGEMGLLEKGAQR
ncbi:HEAT repeat domain-containing protein [Actinoplanes sp. CA-131856]